MRTKRIPTARNEELRIRGKKIGECQVHDWPTDGLAKRLVQAMRDRHPKGIDACPDCVGRARIDLDSHGCCVCERTHVPFSDNDMGIQIGGEPVLEKVTWRCQACKRLVCRDHVHTVPTGMRAPLDREIPERTLCTEAACVAKRVSR